ncbi:MAG: hypothetical protein ACPHY8_05480 [Patescibacteria group bacterium]
MNTSSTIASQRKNVFTDYELLLKKIQSIPRYSHFSAELSVEDIKNSDFDISPLKNRNSQRSLEFIWDNLCHYEVRIRFKLEPEAAESIKDYFADVYFEHNKPTKMHTGGLDFFTDPKTVASI